MRCWKRRWRIRPTSWPCRPKPRRRKSWPSSLPGGRPRPSARHAPPPRHVGIAGRWRLAGAGLAALRRPRSHLALRLAAIGQPNIEHGMLDGIEARAVGEHPAGEDPLLFAVEQGFVDLDERGGLWRLGGRPRIAHARGDPQGTEGGGLIERHLEPRNLGRDLIERGKDGDGIVNALGGRW